ncbi:hypothetical protein PUNSTDRAFT_78417, partial [Punctularia strigosozonata HHB-11173 SS5]
MKHLTQGKGTVAEYISEFREIQGQTEYSKEDLLSRFWDGLSDSMKDDLSKSSLPIETLDNCMNSAATLDRRIRQRQAEKRGVRIQAPFASSTVSHTPARDPMAMDIDATRTVQSYIDFMRGKCYGCGSKDHIKRDGNHERDVCNHCHKTGHRSTVCRSKYFGRPSTPAQFAPPARVRATDQPAASTSTAPPASPHAEGEVSMMT